MEKYKYLNIKELIQIREEVVEKLGLTFKFKDYIMFHINEALMKLMFQVDSNENKESFKSTIENNIYNIYTNLSKEDVNLDFNGDSLSLMITVKNDFFRNLLEEEISILNLVKEDRKRKLDSLNLKLYI